MAEHLPIIKLFHSERPRDEINDAGCHTEEDSVEFCIDGFVTLRLLGKGNFQLDWRLS